MSSVRRLVAGVILTLLTAGYLASQYFYFYGDPVDYASRVDRSEVKWLSLLLFVAAVALWIAPAREREE